MEIEFAVPAREAPAHYIKDRDVKRLERRFGPVFDLEKLGEVFSDVRAHRKLRDTRLDIAVDVDTDEEACQPSAFIRVNYLNNRDKPVAAFNFTVEKQPGETYNLILESASLDKKVQNAGVAALLMQSLKEFREDSEILREGDLTLTAVNVGSYTWLKYGLIPDQLSWDIVRKDIIKHHSYDPETQLFALRVTKQEKRQPGVLLPRGGELKPAVILPVGTCSMTQAEYDGLMEVLNSDFPRRAYALAMMDKPMKVNEDTLEAMKDIELVPDTLGRALFFGRGWDGRLRSNDMHGWQRYERYVDSQLERHQEFLI